MHNMKKIILLLGSPNDENGTISQIGHDRMECAYNLYTHNDNIQILCTGGFGEHFNTTRKPHAHYTKQELIRKGVEEKDILPFALSSNTYEDFIKAKPIIETVKPDVLLIVTSDFHIPRAKILFPKTLTYPYAIFIPAKSTLTKEKLQSLHNHEKERINQLNNKK